MKPRPTISTFAIAIRPKTTLQCQRNIYTQAFAPGLSCQLWQDGSRRRGNNARNWTTQSRYYASPSTQPSTKSTYGRAEAPPPAKTAKTAKTTVPAKTSTASNNRALSPHAISKQTPQVPILKAKENLNPPDFTYAPELNVPARGAQQGFISYIWKCGRSYLTFYKTGVKNVRQTSKLARSLRAKAGPTGKVDYTAELTRAEWQIVRRSRKDMLRLPAFGLIFLVFGEWTPLLVRWITPIIPEPCRIPSQVERDLVKQENKRKDRQNVRQSQAMRLIRKDPPKPGSRPPLPSDIGTKQNQLTALSGSDSLQHMNPKTSTHFELFVLSAQYDLHARPWDWIGVTPPKWLLQRNLAKKVEYLKKDDEMILRDGGWAALEKREVERACVERGIYILGKKEGEMRKALAEWYGSKK
jgi:hypothetical protein